MKLEKQPEKIFDSDLLRIDCQSLLRSLKNKQNVLMETVAKLNDSTLSDDFSIQKKGISQAKTVSFSDYLRVPTTITKISPNRRTRSVSPSKSILKKNATQGKDEDEDLSDTSSLTNSLSNIYADLDIEDDFDENLKNIIKYTDLKADTKTLNKKSLINYISKKRQKYLCHNYNENTSSSNSNLADKNVSIDSSNVLKKKDVKGSVRRSKSADTGSKLRVHSADKSYAKPTQSSLNNTTKPNPKSDKSPNEKKKNYKKIAKQAKKNQPLLGFDWALVLYPKKDTLDTKLNVTATKFEKPDEYWEELSQFRLENRNDCVSSKSTNFNGTMTSFLENDSNSFFIKSAENDEEDGRNHKCIHSYTLNDRLFPVPVYKDKNGQSLCPVCKSTRKDGNSFSPQFCKISIPKSKIIEPIMIEPSKRSNTNSEDTLSLAEHCVAGYQNNSSKNSKASSKNKNIDLKSSTTNKNTINKLSLADLKRIESNRDPATSSLYNKAHAMRYDLEDQHQKRLRELMPKF